MESSDHQCQLMHGQNIRKWSVPELEKLGTEEDLRSEVAANVDGPFGDSNPS